jgi:hypothetical protein
MYRPSGTENERKFMLESVLAQGLVVELTMEIVPRTVASEASNGPTRVNTARISNIYRSEVS